jgi:hypothetical protein
MATVGAAQDDGAPAPEPAPEAAPADPNSWLEGWDGSVSLGLFGSTGNTESMSVSAAASGDRDVEDYKTHARAEYMLKRDDSETTENRFFSLLRNDWKFGESPWRFWAEGSFEFDEFKDWDTRVSARWTAPGSCTSASISCSRCSSCSWRR